MAPQPPRRPRQSGAPSSKVSRARRLFRRVRICRRAGARAAQLRGSGCDGDPSPARPTMGHGHLRLRRCVSGPAATASAAAAKIADRLSSARHRRRLWWCGHRCSLRDLHRLRLAGTTATASAGLGAVADAPVVATVFARGPSRPHRLQPWSQPPMPPLRAPRRRLDLPLANQSYCWKTQLHDQSKAGTALF